jgi:hypothetical protein
VRYKDFVDVSREESKAGGLSRGYITTVNQFFDTTVTFFLASKERLKNMDPTQECNKESH